MLFCVDTANGFKHEGARGGFMRPCDQIGQFVKPHTTKLIKTYNIWLFAVSPELIFKVWQEKE